MTFFFFWLWACGAFSLSLATFFFFFFFLLSGARGKWNEGWKWIEGGISATHLYERPSRGQRRHGYCDDNNSPQLGLLLSSSFFFSLSLSPSFVSSFFAWSTFFYHPSFWHFLFVCYFLFIFRQFFCLLIVKSRYCFFFRVRRNSV